MSPPFVWANLALAFGLELAGLAALGSWGAHVGGSLPARVALAIGAPLVAAVLWGLFASPRAPLATPLASTSVRVAFFLAAALALGAVGHGRLAVVLLALVIVNTVLLSASVSPLAAP